MMKFPRMHFRQLDEGGSGGSSAPPQAGGVGANGLPFVPNVQITGPSSSTDRVVETPEYDQAVARQEQAFRDQAAAEQAGIAAQVELARQQAPLYQAEAERQKRILFAQEQARAEWKARTDEATSQLNERIAKASEDPRGFWDDRTSADRTMSRIAITLGSLTGDNRFLKYLDGEIEKDTKQKQIRSERMFKLAEMSRGVLSDAYRHRAEELGDYDAQRAAGWDVVLKQAEAVAKSGLVPQLQAKGSAAIASIQQEAAKARLQAEENRKTKITSQTGHTVTTIGLGAGGGQVQRETVNDVVASAAQAKLLKEFENIAEKNPEAWNAYRDAVKASDEFDIAKQGGLGGIMRLGQAGGQLPMAVDQRLEKIEEPKIRQDAKRLNQLFPIIQTGEARILDPVGVLNEAAHVQARKHLNMYTMSPEKAIKLSRQFRAQHEEKAGILNTIPSVQRARMQQTQVENPDRPSGPMTPRQALNEAKARLKANPQDKVARQTIDRLKAQGMR